MDVDDENNRSAASSDDSKSSTSSGDSSQSGSDSDSGSGSDKSGSCSVTTSGSDKHGTDEEKADINVTETDESNDAPTRLDTIRNIVREARVSKAIKKLAVEQPDLYGVRRSGRQRTEVSRYEAAGNEGSDSDAPQRKKRPKDRKGSNHSSDPWGDSSSDDSESKSEGSYGEKPSASRRRPPPRRPARKSQSRGSQRSSGRGAKSKPKRLSASTGEEETDSDGSSGGQPSRQSGRHVTTQKVRTKKVGNKSRASKRKMAVQKVSYKEQSDGETNSEDLIECEYSETAIVEKPDAETIERVASQRMGRRGATGHQTTMYNVEDNGDPNAPKEDDTREIEKQYLIKWKGWAHIHNTWESETTLQDQRVNGMKKLENFLKKEDELSEWRRYASREDQEYFDCQQEMMEDLRTSYCKAERIIIQKPSLNSELPDYLIKWQGLPNADATWEDGALVERKYIDELECYNRRQKSQKIPSKICKALRHRPKFVALKKQPSYLGSSQLQLRDYQLEGLNWLVHSWTKDNSVILADEMGLGKTIQTLSYLTVLMNEYHVYGPFLIVVPLSTIVTWQLEIKLWSKDINSVVYLGDIHSRNITREHEWCHPGNKRLKFNVMITTYEILLKDKSFLGSVQWAVLAVDEAHRLKNDDSLLYKSLVGFDTNHRLLITGTPLQNSLKELWSLLHFIEPDKFQSWGHFEDKHSSSDKTGFAQLHKEIEPYLIRRVKKDVEKSLPAKVEQILRVEMSKVQKQYYKWILTKNYRALSKGLKGSIGGFINLIMELKKCCNHSYLVRPIDAQEDTKDPLEMLVKGSGKMILLDKLLMRLREGDHRVLIFSQMVRMLDIIADYLQKRRFPFQRLDGSIRGELRKQALDHFNADGSQDFCFLLSTRAGGLGINLATADTVIIFDSDWNPQNDLQAQARAHRIGQKNQVCVYRFVCKGSVEEDIVERAKKKMVLDHLIIQRMDTTGRTILDNSKMRTSGQSTPFNKEELNAILKFGAEELFKENEDDDDEVDVDEILKRAETRNVEDEEQNSMKNELLSQFKVVSFDNLEDQEIERQPDSGGCATWDDIIPENERKRMEEEEMQQQLMELNLPPRSRKKIKDLMDSDTERKKSGSKDQQGDDSDYSEEEDSEEESPHAGKRGRPFKRETIKGFTNAEIRRFIKSFKKFGRPHDRIDAVAGDAELQEKSHADLMRLADLLQSKCDESMKEYTDKIQNDPSFENKKTHRGPTFKMAGVTVNAKSVLQAEAELEPLAASMPLKPEDRKKYKVDFHVKLAHFDCLWDVEQDAQLLRGVHEYGLGNWEAIKMDPEFKLHDRILPDGQMKPQQKHLQTRVEYILKVLRKNMGIEAPPPKKKPKALKVVKPAKVISNQKFKSAAYVEDEDSDEDGGDKGMEEGEVRDKPSSESKKRKKDKKEKKAKKEHVKKEEGSAANEPKEKKKDKKKKKGKKVVQGGPVHITTGGTKSIANDCAALDLPAEVFTQCKEKMRMVRKALKQLGNPDPDQPNHTRKCLLKIGDHIHEILNEFNDPEVIKEWRSNLWIFVSKFTEFDAARLHKLYKYTVKKREDEKDKVKEQAPEGAETHYGHHPSLAGSGRSKSNHPKKRSSDTHYHGDKTDGPLPSKRKFTPSEQAWSEASREGNSTAPRYGNNSGASNYGNASGATGYGNKPFHRERENREWEANVNSNSNSQEQWQLSSPLAAQDEAPRNRYAESGSYGRGPKQQYSAESRNSENRTSHYNSGRPREHSRFSGEKRDRSSSGYGHFNQSRDHGNAGSGSSSASSNFGRFEHRGEHRPADRHSDNHHAEHRNYRQDFNRTDHGAHNFSSDKRDDRYYGHDRKRRPGPGGDWGDYSDRSDSRRGDGRGSSKDPRMTKGGGDQQIVQDAASNSLSVMSPVSSNPSTPGP